MRGRVGKGEAGDGRVEVSGSATRGYISPKSGVLVVRNGRIPVKVKCWIISILLTDFL